MFRHPAEQLELLEDDAFLSTMQWWCQSRDETLEVQPVGAQKRLERHLPRPAHWPGPPRRVNVVCGWNEDEFQMFGVQKKEHDDRYEQGEEWWSIVTRVWAGEGPFDFRGLRMAHALGRSIEVWTPVGVVCRPSVRVAREFTTYVVDHADLGAVGHLAALHASDARLRTDPEGINRREGEGPIERQVLARGSYCAIGDPDHVASEPMRLHAAGFDGLALNFVDYLEELPFFAQEVLPRLGRAGI